MSSKRSHNAGEGDSAKQPRRRRRAVSADSHQESGGGSVELKTAYQIIRRPVITEKGLAIKENQNTLVFQVAPKATKTEIKEAVQSIFKVKVSSVRTANYPGKERRRGKFAGYRRGLEESLRKTAGRREDAGVRAEFVRTVVSRTSLVVDQSRFLTAEAVGMTRLS